MPATLTINGQSTAAVPGLSLFEHAERLGVRVPTSCQKQGKCKECMVEVTEGMDAAVAADAGRAAPHGHFRLSCQTHVDGDDGDVRCHTMRRGQMRIRTGCADIAARHAGLALDPAVTRDGDRILIDGVEVGRSTGPIHGIAMDLGTTTVVLRLFNLETGELVADASFENPQRFGGSDVMSRIHYDTEHRGKLLMRTLAGYSRTPSRSSPSIRRRSTRWSSSATRRCATCSSGRTCTRSARARTSRSPRSRWRRASATTTSLVASGRRSLLPIHPKARVYGLPIISGHVGADAAACMLAVDLAHEDRLVAVMDIGTNTELIVGNRDRILAASCPAGPAFEGGAIACGMPGARRRRSRRRRRATTARSRSA